MKRKFKRFMRNNKWVIISSVGILTWVVLAMEIAVFAADVIRFQIMMNGLAG